MRVVLSAFLLMTSVSVAGILATSKPLFAQEACPTISQYDAAAVKYDADLEVRDSDFLAAYHTALGVDLPADTKATQMFFIVGPAGVVIGLIEPDGCVNYSAVIPNQAHAKAMAAAETGA